MYVQRLTHTLFVVALCMLVCHECKARSLDSDLDSVLCADRLIHPGTIIDIRTSMNNGAELLDGQWERNVEQCIDQCCHVAGCDLALFKNMGMSESGKNCYFVKCNKPENCVLVEHSGFSSVVMRPVKGGAGVKSSPLPPTTAAPPPSVTTPTPVTTVLVVSHSQPANAPQNGIETTSAASPVSNSDSPSTVSSPTSSSESTDHNSVAPTAPIVVDKQAKNIEIINSKGHKGRSNKDCAKYGCDGSGIIAVAVVGAICFAIVVVVAGILLKRIFEDRRKKKFRNVDYLINGMYT